MPLYLSISLPTQKNLAHLPQQRGHCCSYHRRWWLVERTPTGSPWAIGGSLVRFGYETSAQLKLSVYPMSSGNFTLKICLMLQRKWRETRQQPNSVRSGHQFSCCLSSLHFLCYILPTPRVKRVWCMINHVLRRQYPKSVNYPSDQHLTCKSALNERWYWLQFDARRSTLFCKYGP